MRVISKKCIIFFLCCFCTLNAVDLPQFYRVPFFQETFNAAVSKYTTGFSVRYGHGETRHAWNGHNEKRSLLSVYGNTDITNLGTWVDSDDKIIVDNKNNKTMKNYWGGSNYDQTSVDYKDKVIFPLDYKTNTDYEKAPYNLTLGKNDGLIEFDGKFEIDEWDFTLQQDILWGFYLQVYLPYRDMRIEKIAYKNLGADDLKGVDTSGGPTTVNVADFMTKDGGTLNNVLKITELDSWQTTYKKSGISDLLISAGWHGSGDPQSPIIKRLCGSLQVGILVPTAGKRRFDNVFSIPLGYNDYWGVSGRASAYVQVFDFLGVGAYGGGIVFFTEDRDLRVKTATSQDGSILLQKSFGKLDQGSIWDVCGYAQLGFKGVIAKVGCSYTRQEDTKISVKDSNLLATYKQQQLEGDLEKGIYPSVISVNSIVNTDNKLKAWEYYTLHFIGGYTLELKSFCPSIFIEYDYPVYGKNSFKTDMLGGSLSLQVKLTF